jgi:uncharacterized membrane protein YeaQ/YmgE (transglycosylase-associated protein family)
LLLPLARPPLAVDSRHQPRREPSVVEPHPLLRPLLPGSYTNNTFDDKTVSVGIIGYIVSLLIVGFVIGGLGRLMVPGPNPIGAGRTLGVGLVGAFVGSLVGGLLGIGIFTVIFEVALAAGLVYLVSGRSRQLTSGGHSRCQQATR